MPEPGAERTFGTKRRSRGHGRGDDRGARVPRRVGLAKAHPKRAIRDHAGGGECRRLAPGVGSRRRHTCLWRRPVGGGSGHHPSAWQLAGRASGARHVLQGPSLLDRYRQRGGAGSRDATCRRKRPRACGFVGLGSPSLPDLPVCMLVLRSRCHLGCAAPAEVSLHVSASCPATAASLQAPARPTRTPWPLRACRSRGRSG
jgi:hypothetical protein